MSLSISGAMLPLSSLAIYAAYKETREVAEQRTHLRQQERRCARSRRDCNLAWTRQRLQARQMLTGMH